MGNLNENNIVPYNISFSVGINAGVSNGAQFYIVQPGRNFRIKNIFYDYLVRVQATNAPLPKEMNNLIYITASLYNHIDTNIIVGQLPVMVGPGTLNLQMLLLPGFYPFDNLQFQESCEIHIDYQNTSGAAYTLLAMFHAEIEIIN